MSSETHSKSGFRDNFEAIVIAMIFLNFVRIFVFQSFKIPTGSMIDNLLIGDHLFVNKFVYGVPGPEPLAGALPIRDIRRGDIVIFRFPDDPSLDYVKRVIGLPGESISIRDKVVHVGGEPLAEPYTSFRDATVIPDSPGLPEPFRSRDQMQPYRIPEGSYFVMGDNRDDSYDSRYWGPVARELIKGRPFLIYWSYRADPPDPTRPQTLGRMVASVLDVVFHFFSKTRWDRMFFIVDSRYHYPFRE
ncbi:MAG TPA: signal peptidase I [Thermoanaerobaculia bacterium]|nr:signal peptidase I [Thermoanaerobaculia bacterium]